MNTLLDTIIEDDRWSDVGLPALAARAARAPLGHLGLSAEVREIVLVGCDDARIARLNGDFRAKPRATNVLSWPSAERGADGDGAPPRPLAEEDAELGDVAIAFETCAREADDGGISLENHTMHLVVHATLHLLGYDHERDGDAALMEGIETAILAQLGIDDPYDHSGG